MSRLTWITCPCCKARLVPSLEALPEPALKTPDPAKYFASQDTVAQWLEDEAEADDGCRALLVVAYRSYQRFAQRKDVYAMGLKRFVDTMELKGYRVSKRKGADWEIVGLRLVRGDAASVRDPMDDLL